MIDPKNPFVLKAEAYKRDIIPTGHYISQSAHFLNLRTGVAYDTCKAYVRKALTTKRFPNVKDPTVNYLHRQENGDREPAQLPLTQYLRDIVKNREIMAPTLTTYVSSDIFESVLAKYITGNIAKRSRAKKAMFAAGQAGDLVEEFFQDLVQRNTKLSNNSISGAHASASTPLYNQTNHSTLTSNCRMTSGYGNANNEKMLSGNRHYWKPELVINNIISITQNTDYVKWAQVVEKYNLVIPTADNVMEAIRYSTDLYWFSPIRMQEIIDLVDCLSPMQRLSFLYTGDLHHVCKYNPAFMRSFIGDMSAKVFGECANPEQEIHKYPEDYVYLAHQICSKEMKGKGKDYKKIKDSPELQTLVATTAHVFSVVHNYKDFIEVALVSDNVPAAVPYFPSSIRRCAITSDTDSTIFTVQEWVIWYLGSLKFNEVSTAVASTMIFLASQSIVHILARMSINTGVSRTNMWKIAMKNEFFFPVFVPTNVSKHYFALISCQEGNVYEKIKVEIKGVHLKSSNAPKEINKRTENLMVEIMETVMRGEKISLAKMFKQVADTEREIMSAIKDGNARYCRRGELKSPASYTKGPEQSNYMHHIFWQECFAPKYGVQEDPPYAVVKLSGGLKSPSAAKDWLEKIDPATAERVRAWMRKYNKDKIGAFMIPKQIVDTIGLPEEIMLAINSRRMVADLVKPQYLVLETLGYYGLNKRITSLLSDRY